MATYFPFFKSSLNKGSFFQKQTFFSLSGKKEHPKRMFFSIDFVPNCHFQKQTIRKKQKTKLKKGFFLVILQKVHIFMRLTKFKKNLILTIAYCIHDNDKMTEKVKQNKKR